LRQLALDITNKNDHPIQTFPLKKAADAYARMMEGKPRFCVAMVTSVKSFHVISGVAGPVVLESCTLARQPSARDRGA